MEHCHQTFLLLPGVTISGVSAPLSDGCHCAATPGQSVSKSLKPGRTFRPAQYGQPLPSERTCTVVCHEWPFSHVHQTFFLLP